MIEIVGRGIQITLCLFPTAIYACADFDRMFQGFEIFCVIPGIPLFRGNEAIFASTLADFANRLSHARSSGELTGLRQARDNVAKRAVTRLCFFDALSYLLSLSELPVLGEIRYDLIL